MAIQGILSGFCAPGNVQRHVILTGRGPGYQLIVDGRAWGDPITDIDMAQRHFGELCEGKPTDWRSVAAIATSAETGFTVVTVLGNVLLGQLALDI